VSSSAKLDGAKPVPSESALVERAQDGDIDAFGVLYERHYPQVLGYLYRQTLRVDTAEDLTSNTFFAALRGLRRYRGDSAFSLWLYRIATNELRMWLRSRRRHPEPKSLEVAAEDLNRLRFDRPGEAQSPAEAADRAERFARVRAAIGRLGQRYQEVLILRYFEQLDNMQIAQVLGKRESTVRSLIHRGLSRLRTALVEVDATED
jgi:RNA polymerase sigma-70 factor (ECF subfamily)